jgi:hypothetical protein
MKDNKNRGPQYANARPMVRMQDGSQQYTRGSTGPERLRNISRHENLPDPRRIYSEEDVLKRMALTKAFSNEADRSDAAMRNERQGIPRRR